VYPRVLEAGRSLDYFTLHRSRTFPYTMCMQPVDVYFFSFYVIYLLKQNRKVAIENVLVRAMFGVCTSYVVDITSILLSVPQGSRSGKIIRLFYFFPFMLYIFSNRIEKLPLKMFWIYEG
jgi:hypothetical protein